MKLSPSKSGGLSTRVAVAVAAVLSAAAGTFAGVRSSDVAAGKPVAPVTGPQAMWLILDRSLAVTPVRELLTIGDDKITFMVPSGSNGSVEMSKVLAVVPAGWWQRTLTRGEGVTEPINEPSMPSIQRTGGLLETTDGQRLPGFLPGSNPVTDAGPAAGSGRRGSGMQVNERVKPAAAQPGAVPEAGPADPAAAPPEVADSIRWQHQLLGEFSFKLEGVRRWSATRQPWSRAPVPERDVMVLANGDRLEGFFAGLIGLTGKPDQNVMLKLEPAGGGEVVVPVTRLVSVTLSGLKVEPRGPRLLMADGTDLLTGPVAYNPAAGLRVAPAGVTAVLPAKLGTESIVAYLPEAGAVVDLSGTLAVRPESERAWDATPRLLARSEAGDLLAGTVLMPGWCRAMLTVPEDAARVSMLLVVPESCRVLAECTVTLSMGGKVLERRVLTAADATAEVNVAVPGGGTLVVELADGPAGSGPAHDQVLLRRPIAVRR
jgi:hypothetical protein